MKGPQPRMLTSDSKWRVHSLRPRLDTLAKEKAPATQSHFLYFIKLFSLYFSSFPKLNKANDTSSLHSDICPCFMTFIRPCVMNLSPNFAKHHFQCLPCSPTQFTCSCWPFHTKHVSCVCVRRDVFIRVFWWWGWHVYFTFGKYKNRENNKVEQDLIVCAKPLLFFYYHLLKNPLILILPNDMYLPCHQNIFRCHFTDYVSSNGKN